MTSTRNGYSPRTSGSGESYRAWPLRYEVQQPSRFVGDIFPCTVFPRRFRISWSFVSILEIALLSVMAVVYLALSERVLREMLPVDDKRINELAEWMLRLFGSLLIMQVRTLALYSAMRVFFIQIVNLFCSPFDLFLMTSYCSRNT